MKAIHSSIVTPQQEQATRELAEELGITIDDFAQPRADGEQFTVSLSADECRLLMRIAYGLDINRTHLARGILRSFLKRHGEQRAAA